MPDYDEVSLEHAGTELAGEIVMPGVAGQQPAVLVFPTAFGLGGHVRDAARRLAAEGYLVLIADMYGSGAYSEDQDRIAGLIGPLWGTELQRSRAVAWFELLRNRSDVDATRIAAIGYCFGGQCALELARSGADLRAVLSYHGILTTAMPARPGGVRAHVAVYTGAKDPHAPRDHVDALRAELIAAGADWQITEFGSAYHAFTDPAAAAPDKGRAYDPLADTFAWDSTLSLLSSLLPKGTPPSSG